MDSTNGLVYSDDLTVLFNQIVELQLRNVSTASYTQPTYSKDLVKRRLRKRLYDVLFENTSGRFRKFRSDKKNKMNPDLEISAYVYNMRLQRRFDEANQLESLVKKLKDDLQDKQLLSSVFTFLIGLCDSSSITDTLPIGHGIKILPKVYCDPESSNILPNGPLNYGDTRLYTKQFSNTYMQYPSDIFHTRGVHAKDLVHNPRYNRIDPKIFTSIPGKDLKGSGLFNVKRYVKDSHEKKTRQTLFGALVQNRSGDVNMRLQIPDLPEIGSVRALPELKFPREDLSGDEGFGSCSSTPSGSILLDDLETEENIWDKALKLRPSKHYTWELRGHQTSHTEQRYLTEAGPRAVDEISRVQARNLSLIDPSMPHISPCEISMKVLVQDMFNLLLALPSETFSFSKEKQAFFMKEGTYITGLTSEGLSNLCKDCMECGSNHWRLTEFAAPSQMNSLYQAGLIFQAFTGGVRKYLQHFRACVLSVSQNNTIMEVKFMFNRVMRQMSFLAELCFCSTAKEIQSGKVYSMFPTGVKLLTYLYNESLQAANTDHYPMMLSLLKSACAPYVMFVQDWVFHGVCRDVYSEFMIQVNTDYLQFRDKHYWTEGYVLTSQNATESVPLFLADLANDIYTCGKSINLLRLCCPNHFLCILDYEIPRVTITFSEEELNSVTSRSQAYTSRMFQIAKQKLISRSERLEAENRAKQDLMMQAKKTAAAELDRLQAKIHEIKKAEDKKKRKLFGELKSQMEKDIMRRAVAAEEEREADVARIEELNKHELLEAQVEEELEQQAREELVEYYAKLSEAAAYREQRALWRVRRHKLDVERLSAIQQDETNWQLEMKESQQKDDNEVKKQQEIGSITDHADGLVHITSQDKLENLTSNKIVDSAQVTPEQYLIDMQEIQGRKIEIKPVKKSSDLDAALSAVSSEQASVHTEQRGVLSDKSRNMGTLLDISTATPQPSVESDDVSLVDLPKWAREGMKKSDEKLPLEVKGKDFDDQTEKLDGLSLQVTDMTAENSNYVDLPMLKNVDSLPSWAKEGLKGPLAPAFGLDVVTSDNIPNWAKTALECANDEILHIGVDDVEEKEHGCNAEEAQSSWKSHSEIDVKTSSQSESCDLVNSVYSDGSVSVNQNAVNKSNEATPMKQNAVNVDPTKISDSKQLKLVEWSHSSIESTETLNRPHLRSVDSSHVTKESFETEISEKKHLKFIPGSYSSKESEEIVEKPHLKTFEASHATKESTEVKEKIHIKKVDGFDVAKESVSSQRVSKKCSQHGHSSDESKPQTEITKKASVFGHVSEVSRGEYGITAPRLKRLDTMFATKESLDRSFEVVRRRPRKQPALIETEEMSFRPHIQMQSEMYSTKESEFVDMDAQRLQKFRARNVFGHSSDSSVQRLLYGDKLGENRKASLSDVPRIEDSGLNISPVTNCRKYNNLEGILEEIDGDGDLCTAWPVEDVEPYRDNYDVIYEPPAPDLTAQIVLDPITGIQEYGITEDTDVKTHQYMSLPILMKKSLTSPLLAQVTLVNKCIVNYFTIDMSIEKHFEALRKFLLMQDGEYSQMLSDQLFEKLSTNPHPQRMLNPAFLNSVLSRAVQSSVHKDNEYVKRLSFALKFMPDVFRQNASDTLNCLELRYKVDWPLNIVITDNCLNKYGKVFSFMLQLRRIVWVLKDVVYRLKRSAVINNVGSSVQFRQLQLYRHEMQHFVKVMQGYIANQIIHVTWKEFEDDLTNNVHSLDDLHHRHAEYLNRAIFRCLLNKKAAPLMKVITDIFSLILKFRTQLLSSAWQQDAQSGEMIHLAFNNMVATCRTFKEYSAFLFKVINNLALRGYQPHLQELLLRLNFNEYYHKA